MPDRQQILSILNQRYQQNPESFTEQEAKKLAEMNVLDNNTPEYQDGDGFVRDLLRGFWQVPAGFVSGFTGIDINYAPAKTTLQKIIRNISYFLGFIGFIPGEGTLAKIGVSTGIKGTKLISKYALKKFGKEAVEHILEHGGEAALKDAVKVHLKRNGTNLLGKGVRSLPMWAADRVTQGKAFGHVAGFAAKQIGKSKYLLAHPNAEALLREMGRSAAHLGIASGAATLSPLPWQWPENFKPAVDSALNGAVFGGGFGAIGGLPLLRGMLKGSGKLGAAGLAVDSALSRGNEELADKILKGIAGSMMQGLPSTVAGAPIADQIYEYVLGTYFGVISKSPKEARIEAIKDKVMMDQAPEEAGAFIQSKFYDENGHVETDARTVAKKLGIDGLDPETMTDVIEELRKEYTEIPLGEWKDALSKVSPEYRTGVKEKVYGYDYNGQPAELDIQYRYENDDPLHNKDAVAELDTKTGTVHLDYEFAQKLEALARQLPEDTVVLPNEGFTVKQLGGGSFITDYYRTHEVVHHVLQNHENSTIRKFANDEQIVSLLALRMVQENYAPSEKWSAINKPHVDALDPDQRLIYDLYEQYHRREVFENTDTPKPGEYVIFRRYYKGKTRDIRGHIIGHAATGGQWKVRDSSGTDHYIDKDMFLYHLKGDAPYNSEDTPTPPPSPEPIQPAPSIPKPPVTPPAGTSKPKEAPKPKEEAPKPKDETPKPKEETPKPKKETPKPKEEVSKLEEAPKLEETSKTEEKAPKTKEKAPKTKEKTPKTKEKTKPKEETPKPKVGDKHKDGHRVEAVVEYEGSPITVTRSKEYAYAKLGNLKTRTAENASADMTISFMADSDSPGSRATKRDVTQQKKLWIPLDLDFVMKTDPDKIIDRVVELMNKHHVESINIAGNGLRTWLKKAGVSQTDVDDMVYRFLKRLLKHPDLKNKKINVRSGGQSGADEAGVKAAAKLGIPARLHATSTYRWIDGKGRTHEGMESFIGRFKGTTGAEKPKPVQTPAEEPKSSEKAPELPETPRVLLGQKGAPNKPYKSEKSAWNSLKNRKDLDIKTHTVVEEDGGWWITAHKPKSDEIKGTKIGTKGAKPTAYKTKDSARNALNRRKDLKTDEYHIAKDVDGYWIVPNKEEITIEEAADRIAASEAAEDGAAPLAPAPKLTSAPKLTVPAAPSVSGAPPLIETKPSKIPGAPSIGNAPSTPAPKIANAPKLTSPRSEEIKAELETNPEPEEPAEIQEESNHTESDEVDYNLPEARFVTTHHVNRQTAPTLSSALSAYGVSASDLGKIRRIFDDKGKNVVDLDSFHEYERFVADWLEQNATTKALKADVNRIARSLAISEYSKTREPNRYVKDANGRGVWKRDYRSALDEYFGEGNVVYVDPLLGFDSESMVKLASTANGDVYLWPTEEQLDRAKREAKGGNVIETLSRIVVHDALRKIFPEKFFEKNPPEKAIKYLSSMTAPSRTTPESSEVRYVVVDDDAYLAAIVPDDFYPKDHPPLLISDGHVPINPQFIEKFHQVFGTLPTNKILKLFYAANDGNSHAVLKGLWAPHEAFETFWNTAGASVDMVIPKSVAKVLDIKGVDDPYSHTTMEDLTQGRTKVGDLNIHTMDLSNFRFLGGDTGDGRHSRGTEPMQPLGSFQTKEAVDAYIRTFIDPAREVLREFRNMSPEERLLELVKAGGGEYDDDTQQWVIPDDLYSSSFMDMILHEYASIDGNLASGPLRNLMKGLHKQAVKPQVSGMKNLYVLPDYGQKHRQRQRVKDVNGKWQLAPGDITIPWYFKDREFRRDQLLVWDDTVNQYRQYAEDDPTEMRLEDAINDADALGLKIVVKFQRMPKQKPEDTLLMLPRFGSMYHGDSVIIPTADAVIAAEADNDGDTANVTAVIPYEMAEEWSSGAFSAKGDGTPRTGAVMPNKRPKKLGIPTYEEWEIISNEMALIAGRIGLGINKQALLNVLSNAGIEFDLYGRSRKLPSKNSRQYREVKARFANLTQASLDPYTTLPDEILLSDNPALHLNRLIFGETGKGVMDEKPRITDMLYEAILHGTSEAIATSNAGRQSLGTQYDLARLQKHQYYLAALNDDPELAIALRLYNLRRKNKSYKRFYSELLSTLGKRTVNVNDFSDPEKGYGVHWLELLLHGKFADFPVRDGVDGKIVVPDLSRLNIKGKFGQSAYERVVGFHENNPLPNNVYITTMGTPAYFKFGKFREDARTRTNIDAARFSAIRHNETVSSLIAEKGSKARMINLDHNSQMKVMKYHILRMLERYEYAKVPIEIRTAALRKFGELAKADKHFHLSDDEFDGILREIFEDWTGMESEDNLGKVLSDVATIDEESIRKFMDDLWFSENGDDYTPVQLNMMWLLPKVELSNKRSAFIISGRKGEVRPEYTNYMNFTGPERDRLFNDPDATPEENMRRKKMRVKYNQAERDFMDRWSEYQSARNPGKAIGDRYFYPELRRLVYLQRENSGRESEYFFATEHGTNIKTRAGRMRNVIDSKSGGMKPWMIDWLRAVNDRAPNIIEHFDNISLALLGKPTPETYSEFLHIVTEVNRMLNGKPKLSFLQSFMTPNLISKFFAGEDPIWQYTGAVPKQIRKAGLPTSYLGLAINHFKRANEEMAGDEEFARALTTGMFIKFEPTESIAKYMSVDLNDPTVKIMLNEFKKITNGDPTRLKELYHLSVMRYEAGIGGKEADKKSHAYKRWKAVEKRYDGLSAIEKQFVNFTQNQLKEVADLIWDKYAIPAMRKTQTAILYNLTRDGGRIDQAQKELISMSDDGEEYHDAHVKLDRLKEFAAELQSAEDDGRIHESIRAKQEENYFPHRWVDLNSAMKAVKRRFVRQREYILDKLRKDGVKEGSPEWNEAEKNLAAQEADALARFTEELVEPVTTAVYSDDVVDYNIKRSNPHLFNRESDMDGYSTFIPEVLANTIRSFSKQIHLMDAGLKARHAIDVQLKHLRNQKGGRYTQEQVDRFGSILNNYVRDNLGYVTKNTKTPDWKKYIKAALKGDKPWKDFQGKYEKRGWSDEDIIERTNSWLKKHGYKGRLQRNSLAYMANLEAKYELASLLFYPKTLFSNLMGGTINMISGGSFHDFLDANARLKDPDFKAKIRTMGVMPDLVASELAVVKSVYGADWLKGLDAVKRLATRDKQARADAMTDLREAGVERAIAEKAAYFMTKGETWLRERAFVMGYQKAIRDYGMDESAAREFGLRFVESTQYLYHAAVKPEFARTSMGKVLTRFMTYMWATVGFQNTLRRDAQFMTQKVGREERSRWEKWAIAEAMMLALAALYPFSIFDSSVPPHLDYMKDTAELVFGDKEERKGAFFGTYGLSMVSAPLPSKLLLRPMLTLMNDDWQTYMNRDFWSLFPFGRFTRGVVKSAEQPSYAIERLTGLPYNSILRERKNYRKTQDKYGPQYITPGGARVY